MKPITIDKSKKIVSDLIRNAFDSLTDLDFYLGNRAEELIQSAKDFGLTELAEEMKNDI